MAKSWGRVVEVVVVNDGGAVAAEREGTTTTLILLKPWHLGHTRGPPNFTLFSSMAPLQRNRNTGKQLK